MSRSSEDDGATTNASADALADASTASGPIRGPTSDATVTTLARDPRLLAIVSASGVGLLGTQAIPSLLPAIAAELSVPESQIGLVLSAFFLPTVLLTPVVGAAADIYGRRPVVLTSLATFGVGGLGAFFTDSFPVLLAFRAIQGAAFAGTLPLSVALIGDFFVGPAGTTAQGIRSSVHGGVITVAPIVAGFLATYGWNVPFLLYGGAFLAFALVYVALPEATTERRDDRGTSRETPSRVRAELATYGRRMIDSLRDRNLAVLIVGGFAVFLVRNGMLALVPLYVVRGFDGDTVLAGLVLSLNGVARIVASPFSGRLLVLTSRRLAFMGTMSVVAAGMALFVVAPSVLWLGAGVAVFGVGMALFNPMLNDAVAAATTTESRAGVVSTMMLFKNGANAAGPAGFTLLLAAAGFDVAFGVAVVIALGYVVIAALALDADVVAGEP